MNAIQSLEERVRKRFPAVKTTLDPSSKPAGPWFLDIDLEGQQITVEWRGGHGFGITSKRSPGYGEGPDEVVPDLETASHRVIGLILARAQTTLPKAVRLRELRSARGLSQVELAKRLRINQAAISKLEKRSDLRIRTLRDVVEAMGGKPGPFSLTGKESFVSTTRLPLPKPQQLAAAAKTGRKFRELPRLRF